MTTVQFTLAKTVKGQFTNQYKSRTFATLAAAQKFADEMKQRSDVTDIRILWPGASQ